MTETDAEKIIRLCAAWKSAAAASGGITLGNMSEKYRLRENGIRVHELNFEGLRTAFTGLAEVLLLPGMNTVIDQDHRDLWSWCGELLLPRESLSTYFGRDIAELAGAAIRSSLSGERRQAANPESHMELNRMRQLVLSNNDERLLDSSHLILSYLSFPLLEAVCRRACSQFVDLGGEVIAEFPRRNGQMYLVGRNCNNVSDLLHLLVHEAGGTDLANDLQRILDHIIQHDPTGDGYITLYRWRNSSLHGETSFGTIGGTVLTLALRIAVDELAAGYEAAQLAAWERAAMFDTNYRAGIFGRRASSFYPPHF